MTAPRVFMPAAMQGHHPRGAIVPRPFTPLASGAADSVPRLALRPREAAAAIGLSERKVAALIADRSSGFPYIKVGAATLVPLDQLKQWLAERMSQPQGCGGVA